MFTKYKSVGKADVKKKVTDWDAVFGAIVLVAIGVGVLVGMSG